VQPYYLIWIRRSSRPEAVANAHELHRELMVLTRRLGRGSKAQDIPGLAIRGFRCPISF